MSKKEEEVPLKQTTSMGFHSPGKEETGESSSVGTPQPAVLPISQPVDVSPKNGSMSVFSFWMCPIFLFGLMGQRSKSQENFV